MLSNIVFTTQEKILNRFLKLDPESNKRLSNLAGKVVKYELDSITQYWIFNAHGITLTNAYSGSVDLVLRGSIFDFMRLAFEKKQINWTSMPIQVSGDMEFAETFKDIFSRLDIDWEEQMSLIVGDSVAFPVAQFFRHFKQSAKHSAEDFCKNISDYLQAETNYLVSEEEVHIFFTDIDTLRDDVERLAARIHFLQAYYTASN